MSDRKILRPYQAAAIDALRESFRRGNRRIVNQLATGGGKSIIQTKMAFDHIGLGGDLVLATAPRTELVKQLEKHLKDQGMYHIGQIRGGIRAKPTMPIQIATLQALARREVPKASLVLVDECHLKSEQLEDLMADPEWANVPFVGFSATPWRKGMGLIWDGLVIGGTTKQLIADGWLVPFETYGSREHPDLRGIPTVMTDLGPDYQKAGIEAAMSKPTIIADIVETGKRLGFGRKMITFCPSRAHGKFVTEEYCAAGVSAAYIDGDTDDGTKPGTIDVRSEIKKGLETGLYDVVVNVGVLSVGSDWPFVDCIQLCRPTKSEMLYVQIIGRGLRPSPGKSMLRILDHTDAWDRLGPVDEIHYDELDDGTGTKCSPRKKPEEAKPKECPNCHFVKPPRTPVCPECQFHAQPQPKINVVDGKLEKVTKSKGEQWTTENKEDWYWKARGYYLNRGSNADQAYYRFEEMFGHFPQGYEKRHRQPSADVVSFIKGQAARRAIARAAMERKNQASAGGRP
jgi:DNA repair protein RadD